MLCHYTSLEGALGIIGTSDLWLSNTRFCNDDEEMRYGRQLVDAVLGEMEAESTTDQTQAARLVRIREQLDAARDDHVYVCCFCERNDLLSQWRGYAENGGGVSIEFDAAGFGSVAGPDCVHGLMRLWKVFYDSQQQRGIIRRCIDYPYWPPGNEADRIQYVVDAILFFIPTFKNADFREEQERQLIFTPSPASFPKPKFRKQRGLLVPYFSLQELAAPKQLNFRLPIAKVVVGPSPNRMLNVESMAMFLNNCEYTSVPVLASTIPYRS